MAGIDDVGTEFLAFCRWLVENRKPEVELLGSLANGFEGWLKIEWLSWLHSVRGLRLDPPPGREWGDVGVEYHARLDQRRADKKRTKKRVDLWVRDKNPERYHYVEIKAPFRNKNAGKLLDAAGHDLFFVTRLKKAREQVASGSLVLAGVGFDDATWSKAVTRVEKRQGSFSTQDGTLGSNVRWRSWTISA